MPEAMGDKKFFHGGHMATKFARRNLFFHVYILCRSHFRAITGPTRPMMHYLRIYVKVPSFIASFVGYTDYNSQKHSLQKMSSQDQQNTRSAAM
jgi:amino acid permease